MKKKPCRPSILNGLKEQLEGQFQMSEGHVLEYKELKAQTNIEVPTHVKPCNVHSIIWFSMYVNLSIICIKVKF